MTDSFILMLRTWQSFYMLVGTASATLTGLTFIAVSLGSGLVPSDPTQGVHTWLTPIMSHFVVVLLISIVTAVPTLTAPALSLLLGLGSLVSMRYVIVIGLRMREQAKHHNITLVEAIWNVFMPALAHLLILLSAIGLLLNVTQTLEGVAVAVTLLLVTAIRNIWDMSIWIVQNQHR